MDYSSPAYIVLVVALCVAVMGLVVRLAQLLAHPNVKDPSPPKGSAGKGVVYSFTVGMLPWKKESARLHEVVYIRGILFHIGIFTGIALIVTSLFVDVNSLAGSVGFSPTLGLGVLAGIGAIIVRFADKNLRALTKPDDFISLVLVTLMMLTGFLLALNIASREFFWGAVSALCLYIPWSKIPHVIYFFFARNVFGITFGRRGVLPAPKKAI